MEKTHDSDFSKARKDRKVAQGSWLKKTPVIFYIKRKM